MPVSFTWMKPDKLLKVEEGGKISLLDLYLEEGDSEDGVEEDLHQSCPARHIDVVNVKGIGRTAP